MFVLQYLVLPQLFLRKPQYLYVQLIKVALYT